MSAEVRKTVHLPECSCYACTQAAYRVRIHALEKERDEALAKLAERVAYDRETRTAREAYVAELEARVEDYKRESERRGGELIKLVMQTRIGPPLEEGTNTIGGKSTFCSHCGEAMPEAHSWEACAKALVVRDGQAHKLRCQDQARTTRMQAFEECAQLCRKLNREMRLKGNACYGGDCAEAIEEAAKA